MQSNPGTCVWYTDKLVCHPHEIATASISYGDSISRPYDTATLFMSYELVSRVYEISTVSVSYGRVINSSA